MSFAKIHRLLAASPTGFRTAVSATYIQCTKRTQIIRQSSSQPRFNNQEIKSNDALDPHSKIMQILRESSAM
ncbi:6869_t:CDS:2, partial [Acaulospora morrowiae]